MLDWFERHGDRELLSWTLTVHGVEHELLVSKSGKAWIVDISAVFKESGPNAIIKRMYMIGAESHAKEIVLSDTAYVYARDLAYCFSLDVEPDPLLVRSYEDCFIKEITAQL